MIAWVTKFVHRITVFLTWLPISQVQMQMQNHSTQDSHVVPHHGTDWAALWLTAQIKRDVVLSESYGRGCLRLHAPAQLLISQPLSDLHKS